MKIPLPTVKVRMVFKIINRFIFIMTFADFLIIFGFGLIAPILAVYFTRQIRGGTLEVVGFSSMIFFIMTALFRIPIAKAIDKNRAEYDDFYVTFAGYLLLAVIPFIYIFISKPIHLYLTEALHGLANSMAYPGWMALFTRHIDKGKEGFGWSFYSTVANVGAAAGAAFGGMAAQRMGFHFLFVAVGCFALVGAFCFLLNRRAIITKGHVPEVLRKEKVVSDKVESIEKG
jgi:MFS family permease